jgi:hypothetical protein
LAKTEQGRTKAEKLCSHAVWAIFFLLGAGRCRSVYYSWHSTTRSLGIHLVPAFSPWLDDFCLFSGTICSFVLCNLMDFFSTISMEILSLRFTRAFHSLAPAFSFIFTFLFRRDIFHQIIFNCSPRSSSRSRTDQCTEWNVNCTALLVLGCCTCTFCT